VQGLARPPAQRARPGSPARSRTRPARPGRSPGGRCGAGLPAPAASRSGPDGRGPAPSAGQDTTLRVEHAHVMVRFAQSTPTRSPRCPPCSRSGPSTGDLRRANGAALEPRRRIPPVVEHLLTDQPGHDPELGLQRVLSAPVLTCWRYHSRTLSGSHCAPINLSRPHVWRLSQDEGICRRTTAGALGAGQAATAPEALERSPWRTG
jgi:hypothetical protein